MTIQSYGTPTGNREVFCIHCSDIYNEQDLVFQNRFGIINPRTNTPLELWWCRNESCDGAGMGHDIYPIDDPFVQYAVWCAQWKAEHGFHPSQLVEPIVEFAKIFAPRKTLTTKHKLKNRVLNKLDRMKAGAL